MRLKTCLANSIALLALTAAAVAHAQQKSKVPAWESPAELSTSTDTKIAAETRTPVGAEESSTGLRIDEYLMRSKRLDAIAAQKSIEPESSNFVLQEILIPVGNVCQLVNNPPPPSCSLTPVNGSLVSFTPVSLCDADQTFLTDVSATGRVVGYYRKPNNGDHKFFGFKVEARQDGGYTDPRVLNYVTNFGSMQTQLHSSFALGISQNGSVVVGAGFEDSPFSPEGTSRSMRWPQVTSNPTLLPLIPDNNQTNCTGVGCSYPDPGDVIFRSEAVATDLSGTKIVGSVRESTNPRSVRGRYWTTSPTVSATQIPDPTGYTCATVTGDNKCWSVARGLTGDGRGVAGFIRDRTDLTIPVTANYLPSLGYRWDKVGSPTGSWLVPSIMTRVLSWAPGTFNLSGLFTPEQLIEAQKRAVFPRHKALGIAPDGWAVVGQDSIGQVSYGNKPTFNVPSFLRFPVDPDNATPEPWGAYQFQIGVDPQYTPIVQTIEGYRWRAATTQSNPYYTTGVVTRAGDIPDVNDGSVSTNFPFSRMNDSSNGGCTTIGQSYAGADPLRCGTGNVPGSDAFMTAVVRPWIAPGPCADRCTSINPLKDQLNRMLSVSNKNVDFYNQGGAQWQLIDAVAASPNGKVIVGTAVCHGMIDNKVYGYIAYIK